LNNSLLCYSHNFLLLLTPFLLSHLAGDIPQALFQGLMFILRIFPGLVVFGDASPACFDGAIAASRQKASGFVLPVYVAFVAAVENFIFEDRPFQGVARLVAAFY
jgi:hypothetical protein